MDFMQNEVDCSATEFLRNCEFLLPDASFLDNSILGPASNLPQRNHRDHRDHRDHKINEANKINKVNKVNESQVSLASDIYYSLNADHGIQDIAPAYSVGDPVNEPRGTYTVKVFFRPDCMETKYADWTKAEKLSGRRVVRFRAQVIGFSSEDGQKRIMVDCEPVLDSRSRQYRSNECYISCICTSYLEDFYITSSDIIRLLECIVSIKFSQEQKTRMRRNIQSLRPSVITRHTHESLFRTITTFTNPVALHTKKEINIFLWSSVQLAISKLSSRFTSS